MSKYLILVSHGNFSQELKKSVEMIMGPQENIHAIGLNPEEGAEDFEKRFLSLISNLDDFVVLADLMGGTPCNVVAKSLMKGLNFDLYTGMNMPMVIGFINSTYLDDTIDLKKFGSENIYHVNDILYEEDDE